jgi:hypothetical protein
VSDDPTVIRVLAIHAEDVLSALEANERRDVGAVLRVTPPFAGRMRARIHRAGAGDGDPRHIHIAPRALVSAVAPFPTVDATEDALRAADDYTPEAHHAAHVERVRAWRAACRARLVEEVTLDTEAGPHRVRVAMLG